MSDALSIEQVEAAGGFPVIYADPPWRYSNKGRNGAAEKHYATMSLDDICALPVSRIAAKDCALFLWGTYPQLPAVMRVIEAWGFTYKSIGFQWVKTYPNAKPFFGLGSWTRGNTEPCFLAVRGSPKRVDMGVSQIVLTDDEHIVAAPIGEHSAKPAEVRTRIERLMGPQAPAVELFARERVPGWEAWGNEIESSVRLT